MNGLVDHCAMLATPLRLPAPTPFELWFVPLAAGLEDEDVALLDEHERGRAARFVFGPHRRRYVAAHAGLRRLLGRRLGIAPAALAFEAGAQGKPALRGAPRCSFSLSRSGDQALVALAADGEIGVDLEQVGVVRDIDALARQSLGAREQADFDAVPEAGRERAFLRAWTRKEACLKAIGTGLRVEPASFETGLAADARQVRIEAMRGRHDVAVQSFEPMPGWVGALAWTLC